MKINLLYIGLAALLFSACNPNEDFIDTLDSEVKLSGIDIPSQITIEKAYVSREDARLEIAKHLNETYSANSINEKDLIVVDYMVETNKFLSGVYSDKQTYELVDTDYTEFSEQKYTTFSTGTRDRYLPLLLEDMYRKSGYQAGTDKLVKYTLRGSSYEYREYKFDGTKWTKTDKVNSGFDTDAAYKLSDDDYKAMGSEKGEPGKYKNFDSKMNIDEFIIAFLPSKYAGAKDKDIVTINYKYYGNKSDQIIYTLTDNGKWIAKGKVVFDWAKGDFKLTGITDSYQDKFVFKTDAWELIVITAYTVTKADYTLSGDDKHSNYGYYDNKAGEYPKGVKVENILIAKLVNILTKNFPDAKENALYQISYNYYADRITKEVSKRFKRVGDSFVEIVE